MTNNTDSEFNEKFNVSHFFSEETSHKDMQLDAIILTTETFLDDSFWYAKHEARRYVIISKHIFDTEIKPHMTLKICEDKRLIVPSLGIPIIEDDELAQEIFIEVLGRAMNNLTPSS